MSAFTVRAATIEDAKAIAAVQVRTWQEEYRGIVADDYIDSLTVEAREAIWRERLLGITVSRPATFVAESGGVVVGFIAGGPIREPEGDYDAEVYSAYVLPDHQRRGAGTLLAGALVGQLRGQRYLRLLTRVLAANPCRAFFEKLAGRPVRESLRRIGGQDYPEVLFGWQHLSDVRI